VLRHESHTSREWRHSASLGDVYFGNMQLYQDRTRWAKSFRWPTSKLQQSGKTTQEPHDAKNQAKYGIQKAFVSNGLRESTRRMKVLRHVIISLLSFPQYGKIWPSTLG